MIVIDESAGRGGGVTLAPATHLDGRVGEGWGGDAGPTAATSTSCSARAGTPTAAAMLGTLTTPAPGHTPIMVVVGEDAGPATSRCGRRRS